jgi:hypothetical protein
MKGIENLYYWIQTGGLTLKHTPPIRTLNVQRDKRISYKVSIIEAGGLRTSPQLNRQNEVANTWGPDQMTTVQSVDTM